MTETIHTAKAIVVPADIKEQMFYQRAVEACGRPLLKNVGPGGVDKGKGGKYAFLPPGYDKSEIPGDYIPTGFFRRPKKLTRTYCIISRLPTLTRLTIAGCSI